MRVLPRDEAFAIPDLIRTKVNLLPEGIAVIRVVEIAGLDLQADGGTHVANTGEVGGIAGHRLRVEGSHQQADPDRAGEPAVARSARDDRRRGPARGPSTRPADQVERSRST